jgi:hypothetical protein
MLCQLYSFGIEMMMRDAFIDTADCIIAVIYQALVNPLWSPYEGDGYSGAVNHNCR